MSGGGFLGQNWVADRGTWRARLRRLRPGPSEYRRMLRMRLADYAIKLNGDAIAESTWMGVRALKNPLDAWIYQEIIWETRPERIVELGSAFGGSTLFLAQLLELVGGEGAVVSVDASRDEYTAAHERISLVTGYTNEQPVIDAVRELCEGRRTMLIHDAGHRAHVVLEDLRTYGPLVSPGCYLIVEDGIGDIIPARKIRHHPGDGPYVAIRQFLAEGQPFDADAGRERFLMTNNPRGFLRRR